MDRFQRLAVIDRPSICHAETLMMRVKYTQAVTTAGISISGTFERSSETIKGGDHHTLSSHHGAPRSTEERMGLWARHGATAIMTGIGGGVRVEAEADRDREREEAWLTPSRETQQNRPTTDRPAVQLSEISITAPPAIISPTLSHPPRAVPAPHPGRADQSLLDNRERLANQQRVLKRRSRT
jgi:hypothetical protein